MTELGDKLRAIRQKIVDSGVPLISDLDDLEREVEGPQDEWVSPVLTGSGARLGHSFSKREIGLVTALNVIANYPHEVCGARALARRALMAWQAYFEE